MPGDWPECCVWQQQFDLLGSLGLLPCLSDMRTLGHGAIRGHAGRIGDGRTWLLAQVKAYEVALEPEARRPLVTSSSPH